MEAQGQGGFRYLNMTGALCLLCNLDSSLLTVSAVFFLACCHCILSPVRDSMLHTVVSTFQTAFICSSPQLLSLVTLMSWTVRANHFSQFGSVSCLDSALQEAHSKSEFTRFPLPAAVSVCPMIANFLPGPAAVCSLIWAALAVSVGRQSHRAEAGSSHLLSGLLQWSSGG